MSIGIIAGIIIQLISIHVVTRAVFYAPFTGRPQTLMIALILILRLRCRVTISLNLRLPFEMERDLLDRRHPWRR